MNKVVVAALLSTFVGGCQPSSGDKAHADDKVNAGDKVGERKGAAAVSEMSTRNVKVEPGIKPYPDAFCGSPTQLHNYNNIPVNVSYTLYYEGKGPEQHCRSKWSSSEKMRLERYSLPDAKKWLGCGKYHYAGNLCTEERSWEVDVAQPAQPLAVDRERRAR